MSDIKLMNFKKVEIVAKSKAEAQAKVAEMFGNYQGDATQAYKRWFDKQVNGVTDRDKKAFMLNYIATKAKNCPGAGFLICVDAAVADTKERPYKINNVKNEQGKRKQKKALTWVDRETGHIVAQVKGTKTEAANVIKKLYKSGEYNGNADCKIQYEIVEGNPIVMTAEYKPSKGAKNGTWVAFGLENC